MIRKLTLSLFILIIAFYACKKESENEDPGLQYYLQLALPTGDTILIIEGLQGVNSFGRGGAFIDTNNHYFEKQST